MILQADFIRSRKTKYFTLLICFVFLSFFAISQTGVRNNGAKMIVNAGAVMKITGSGADYTNTTLGGTHGRIDLDGKIELQGDWINNASSGSVMINPNTDGDVLFNGTTLQSILGSASTLFENITINNTSGLSLSADINVRNILTLTNGLVTLNTSNVIIGTGGSLSGTFGSTKMFVTNSTGALRKLTASTGSFTFPIGEVSGIAEYSPVNFNLTGQGGFSSAWVGARVINTKHINNSSPSEYLNRYWALSSSGITAPVYNAVFTYLQADVVGTENNIYSAEYDGATRSVFSTVNATSNLLSVTGLSAFADYTGVDGTVPTVIISTTELNPTNADPIPFSITFSEEVTDFVYTDITIDNGSTASISTSDNIVFTFDVEPTLDGDVTIDVNAGVAKDIAGNDNIPATTYTIEYDSTNPTVAITSVEPNPTNSSFNVSIHFNEVVTGFDATDVTVGNGTKGSFTPNGNDQDWTLQILPTTDGIVTVDINSGIANDAAGNGNNAASQYSIMYDATDPEVTLTSLESDPTNTSPFVLTIEFDEGVTDFVLTDLTLGNCNAGNYIEVKTDTIFTVEITPIADGTVTVDLTSGKAHDYAGNANTAATQFSIVYDGTKPEVSITSVETNPTNSSFDVSIYFDEIVSDFVVGDITLGNGTKGTFTPNGNDQDWTLQINPTTDGSVTVDIAADVAIDAAGNGNISASTYSITYDGTDPVVSTLYPEDNQLSVALTDNLQMTFNEKVFEGTGNIEIRHTSDNSLFQSISVASLSGYGTKTITINPNDFLSQIEYYVQVPSGAFEDNAGNTFGGISSTTAWSFTTVDANNPVISSVNPIDESGNVSITSNLVITFNENVTAVSGKYITIVNEATTLTHESIEASNTGKVSISGAVVTIDLGTDFVGETTYHVLIDNGAFEDGDSNPFGGISSTSYWNFTTEDIASPTVSSLSPVHEATNVAINSNLVITFNEDVFIGTGSITITDASGPTVHETIAVGSVSITNNVVTINPTIDFDGEADYYVEIDATAFKDASDNYYAGISGLTLWNFTTEDVTSPTVAISTSESSPTNSSPFEITITFNEVMVGFVAGDISVSNGTPSNLNTSDNKVFTADITAGSDGDVICIVPIGAAQDASGNGNDISNQITIEFDGTSPTVVITTGQSGTIATDLDITITFNEEITDLLTGNITVSNGTVTNLSNVTPGMEWDATISPTADGTVTVEILADELTDIAGNGNIISNQITIEYDASGPEIIGLVPDNLDIDVPFNSDLQITFDENIILNTGFDIHIFKSGVGEIETIDAVTLTGNGTSVVTINPSNFDSEATYYIEIDAQAFTDDLGNGFAGLSSGWEFTAEDIIAPTVDNLSPNGVSNVLVNANLEITFSEDVDKNVGIITIMNADTEEEHELIDVALGQVNVVGNVATINPSNDFIGETNYYVLVGESTFQDVSTNQNNFAGISSTTDWTFYTEDVEPPVISTKSPSDNALNIAISANLIITFSENVVEGSGNIVIMNASGPSVHESIGIGSGNVSISGSEITINPTTDFDGLSNYYVLIDATAIEDAFGNSFAGISDPLEWNFMTVDASAPATTGFVPNDGATGVTANPNLVITFNEDVNAISGKFITIKNSTTGLTHETIDAGLVTGDGTTTITIDPTIDFDDLSSYYVLIEYGAFQDVDANSYPGITDAVTWNFSTGDNTVPIVSTLTPADNATDVAVTSNLVIEFSENINAISGNIRIVNSTTSATVESISVTSGQVIVSANTVTINPALDFAGNTDYHVLIDNDAFRDAAGNSYTGISGVTTWNFTTIDQGDITDPTIVSVLPEDDATDVLITANLQITFSENVIVNTGSIIIMEGTTEHESIDVTSGQVTISSNVVTINPGVNFSSETDYHILIDNDAFRDEAGNSYAGISSSTVWNFTTILVTDVTDPTILSVSPIDDATNVSINSNLQITFSENVVANTGLITIMTGTTTQESIDVLSTKVTIASDIVTIDPGFDFDEETEYYVLIDDGAFHDESGNPFAGISDQTAWNFTTEDITQPTVTITSTASGTVNGSFDVTITFSEVVTGFTEGDVTLGNGTIADFTETTAGRVWTVTIDPTTDGDVTIDVNASVAQDAAGNNNIAATQFSIIYDSGVGFEDMIPYEISIYSVKNRVIIEFTNEGNYQFKEGLIEVYNLLGQKIVEKNIEKFERFETEVEHVTQIYVVKVIIDGTDYTKRLYIE